MASGGNSSRNLNKEKGPMHNLLEHVGGDVNYDRSYHEFLQDQFGSDHPSSPNPPLIIPEFDGLNHDPNTPNTNENLFDPHPLQMIFFASEGEEKQMKSILFRVHMKKTELDGGFFYIQCNYCSKSYKTAKSFGYGTYWAHIKRSHPSEFEKSNNQDQIARMYGPSLNLPVSQPPPTSGGTSTSSKFQLKGLGDRLFSQRAKKLRTSSSSSVSELARYLEDTHEFLEEKFSLQVWWKTHQQDYPILAIIAKQILGTPVSTVAVEQEFSAGGNILEPRRSVMSPQSLEMQACVDDWTKAKYRQQELQPEIVNDFFEDDQTTGTEGSD
ncbi:hypothetical protein LWI28_002505 [Acer negundo]|uniref:HAT C-terminal dimerisation domain-containing protein n=1 Tax=Acer negundo TaxID=4023 RepID=A0AAD5J843_ACENE|nr:hypothetical protein LWI28_002505 [Acer negundo]